MIFGGINDYLNGHKNINIKNNGNIIDSIILIHELSHYRNQPENNRGQVNDLLTESLVFAEELIYTDYLDGLGFTYESYNMKKTILKILYQRIEEGYYLLKMYLLYDKLGKVSKDNYKYYYKDDSTYKEALDSSINCLKYDKDDIFNILWYTLASHLSIYLYMCYKNNTLFINNIKNFNDNLLNKRDLQECLSTIGIDGYTKESRDKVELAIKEFIEELEDKKQEKILKLK